jgi:deoxyribodipyrimidine photo-lyase
VLHAAIVITDDDVMPRARRGRELVAEHLSVPFISVDCDVVVPGACFEKHEYAARTIRPKLHRIVDRFAMETGRARTESCWARERRVLKATPPGGVVAYEKGHAGSLPVALIDELAAAQRAGVGTRAKPVSDAPSGRRAAMARLTTFLDEELAGYATRRNQPQHDATSRLSRFIRFGQLGAGELFLAARDAQAPDEDRSAFIEESFVRRELAQNFVRFNPLAHTLAGAPQWAQRTLASHTSDDRPWLWNYDALEAGNTHDPLWNAAQHQLTETGHMHGYMRMYWAKKILEWHADPAEAFDVALDLNDRWHLDGRDPNGITGVAWAIGGVHDRPWGERTIFGTVRYMSLASTGRKFDSRAYIARWDGEQHTPALF